VDETKQELEEARIVTFEPDDLVVDTGVPSLRDSGDLPPFPRNP